MLVISKLKGMALIEDEDRLSSLPDSLLITIISLLHPREMVQTCLLSKRWRSLWSFVPCLDFPEFYSGDKNRICEGNNLERYPNFVRSFFSLMWSFVPRLVFGDQRKLECRDLERFQNFVTSFLRLRDDATPLHTFMLKHEISPQSLSWVHYALTHNPRILKIIFLMSKPKTPFDLTDHLFTCASIETLYLCFARGTKLVFNNVLLPKLRKMLFGGITVDGDNMNKFLSGCPALQILAIGFCKLNANCISFQTVKKLVISDCEFRTQLEPPSFSISAPGLEELFLHNNVGHIKLKDMSKVKKAKITTKNRFSFYSHEYESSFSVVEDLEMACYSDDKNHQHWLKEKLEGELHNCPTFHKLKKLVLGGGCIHCNFDVLASFLEHCPNLKCLTLSRKDDTCQVHSTHNDLGVDQLVRLLVKSALGQDQISITLLNDSITVVITQPQIRPNSQILPSPTRPQPHSTPDPLDPSPTRSQIRSTPAPNISMTNIEQEYGCDPESMLEYKMIVKKTFPSLESAEEFFYDYAKRKGFGVKKIK